MNLLRKNLKDLIEELDRVHSEYISESDRWIAEKGLPNFTTAENGLIRHFSKKALIALNDVAAILYGNDKEISSAIEIREFVNVVKQCIADMHASDSTKLSTSREIETIQKILRDCIKAKLTDIQLEFTHYFPAWTLGMEKAQPFSLGPVTIMTMDDWIDSVDFPQELIEKYASLPEQNAK